MITRPIKVVAPASGISPDRLAALKQLDQFILDIPADLITQDNVFHANSDEVRFQQLKAALFDSSVDTIVWTLRGGYGAARLLDRLKALPSPSHEKTFIGYSDNTALHLFLSQQWHWRTLHASGLSQLIMPEQDPQNYLRIAEIVAQKVPYQIIPELKPLNQAAQKTSILQGALTGGNLTIVESSLATHWQIQTAGKIVFLEDIGEKGYRIDRSLNHLAQAGCLNDVQAIIFGEFLCLFEEATIQFALARFAQDTNIPVFKTDCFGHGKKNYPLIYNAFTNITRTSSDSFNLIMTC